MVWVCAHLRWGVVGSVAVLLKPNTLVTTTLLNVTLDYYNRAAVVTLGHGATTLVVENLTKASPLVECQQVDGRFCSCYHMWHDAS